MDSTVNALANGGTNGIGNRLIGLQPPLSPPPVASAAPSAPAPAPIAPAPPPPVPAAETPPSQSPSSENLLVRFGLITPEQVDEALQEQRATGKHVAQIAVERGWVTREQLAQLVTQPPATPAPAPPEPTPAPVAPPVLEVAPEPEPEPMQPEPSPEPTQSKPAPEPTQSEPALETVARVFARLSTGERIEIASFPELRQARDRAADAVRGLSATRPEWPFICGRFVRPEAIVSVDVEATLA
jgi:hypothetical protein